MTKGSRILSTHRKGFISFWCGLASMGLTNQVLATEFFTIIGPDGRPMVVQQSSAKKSKNQESEAAPQPESQKQTSRSQNLQGQNQKIENSQKPLSSNQAVNMDSQSNQHTQQVTEIQSESKTANSGQMIKSNVDEKALVPKKNTQNNDAKAETAKVPKTVSSTEQTASQKRPYKQLENSVEKSVQNRNPTQMTTEAKLAQMKEIENKKNPQASSLDVQNTETAAKSMPSAQKNANARSSNQSSKPHQNITEIDGVKYVDNEYLEDKEFNLEGRKRFYVMPDSSIAGSSRFETVEREKGITKSVFSKFMKNTPTELPPVVLAPTYYRLPKDEVIQNLEQACFTGKKLEKAKELSLNNMEIGFWPVPPLKEKFVYDVVKLEPAVQNIHFSSYASSQKNPSYYWPLVVFLDQQGCVIEGVSGFKNQSVQENNLKYSALEGVLKKPDQAMYLFMTPLAESIDVQDVQLSNKGQIKLSVLR